VRSPTTNINKTWIFWIVLIITLVYAPFFSYRVIRMAGDEKVYVSQALEMAARGNWFVQTLHNQPDYYKGPLHYLLLRLGLIIFGYNTWAALYMNYFLLLGGAISVGALVRRYASKWSGGSIWAGTFFATCVGIYTHSFASQMETELACLFAIALFLLDSMGPVAPGYLFWTVVGLIGWSKSPLHSLLGGLAAIQYWLLTGQLWSRLKNWKCWAAVILGIFVCTAGFLPAYILDHDNFVAIYLGRETLEKGSSGQHWSVSLVSVLGFYLFPWLLLCIVAYAEMVWGLISGRFGNYRPELRRALILAFSWITPSFVFFWYHPYHFENYNLPVISGVILLISLTMAQRSSRFLLSYRLAALLTGLILLSLPVSLSILSAHFAPLPFWWPKWLAPVSWIATGTSAAALIYYGWFDQLRKMHALAIGIVGFYLTLGCTITVIGERELVGIRQYSAESDSSGQHLRKLGYYNLHQNIWSEWGFLNLWLDRPVYGIHNPQDLKSALLAGETVIVPARGPLTDFRAFVEKEIPGIPLNMVPWKRWRTQGKAENGDSLWTEAWDKRDLSILETDYFIVRRR
jgi:4-amino-4-deoxy-L-arabinose transferase-like glycosyltransferase